jgi:iron complex outermembrane recepter protein
MGSPRRGLSLAGLVIGFGAAAAPAWAADIVVAIPEQPREDALLALGRQAGLSLGFAPDARCGGRAGLSGRMSIDEALSRLLAGSACVAFRPDARTVVIRARSRPARPPVETVPSSAPVQVGDLVVTASKTEALLSATPYGLTAATGAELQRRGVNDMGDLSLLAAGVTVTNLGPGRDKILLRGLSDGPLTGHTQSTVGLYLGDLRLTYNAPDPDLPLIDMARVEVLRGPQGSLYGAGSIGGILQLVPNAPDPGARSGSVTVSLADTAHGAASYGVAGVFNQPLADGRAAVRVAAWSEVAGGYIDDPVRSESDIDRSKRRGVRVSGRWRAADDLSFNALVVGQSITTRDAHYAEPAVGELARATATSEPHDNDFLALALEARWTPAQAHLTVSLGALDHDVGTTHDAAAAPVSLVAPGGHPESLDDSNHIRALVGEARLTSVGPGRLHWTLGAFGSVGRQKLDAVLTPVEPVAGYTEVRRDKLVETAAFGEVSYDLTSELTATVGGRLFHSRLRTRSEVAIDAPVRDFAGHTSDTGFAPKALVAYRPAPGFTFYVQAAEGYRTPGFNTSGPDGQAFGDPGGDQPLRRYGGDELWNYEAGLRWRSSERGLAVRVAAFRADWEDIQADLILPSGLPFTANLGNGRSHGVEIEASYARGAFSISGNVVRQEPELRRPAPGLPERRDTGLPGVPDLSYAAVASYAAPLSADWTLDLTGSYAYVGRSRLTFDAVTDPRMGGYGDLRVGAALRSEGFSVGLYVDNALDEHGDTLAFGNPFSFRTTPQTTPQQPRTIRLRASRAF